MLNISNDEKVRLLEMWNILKPHLNEQEKRLFVAAMANAFGHGGVKISQKITGVTADAIKLGVDQLIGKVPIEEGRERRSGGGRKRITDIYPDIKAGLDKLIEPTSKGDPESPLRWTSKSTYKLAEELTARGFPVSSSTVQDLLKELGYSLQANKKSYEGTTHPDRDKQFEYINNRVGEFQNNNQPAISVDAKKKELIGNFKNGGKEY